MFSHNITIAIKCQPQCLSAALQGHFLLPLIALLGAQAHSPTKEESRIYLSKGLLRSAERKRGPQPTQLCARRGRSAASRLPPGPAGAASLLTAAGGHGAGPAGPLPPLPSVHRARWLSGHVPGPRRSVPAELAPSSLPGSGLLRRSVAMNIFRLTGDLSHLAAIIILLLKIWKSRSCAGACGRPPGGPGERGRAGPGRAEGWALWPPPRCRPGPGGAEARLRRSAGAAPSPRRGGGAGGGAGPGRRRGALAGCAGARLLRLRRSRAARRQHGRVG